jgi:hypothetical protein
MERLWLRRRPSERMPWTLDKISWSVGERAV